MFPLGAWRSDREMYVCSLAVSRYQHDKYMCSFGFWRSEHEQYLCSSDFGACGHPSSCAPLVFQRLTSHSSCVIGLLKVWTCLIISYEMEQLLLESVVKCYPIRLALSETHDYFSIPSETYHLFVLSNSGLMAASARFFCFSTPSETRHVLLLVLLNWPT